MSKEDLYIILEVRRTASVNDIKRAFRKLARRYHPDINPGDRLAEDRFKRITEAYEVLSDPSKRQFYDVNGFYTEGVLEPHAAESGWGLSFQGFDFSRPGQSHFGDIFGRFFARQAMRRDPERGQDLEYPVSIGFDESIRGLTARISVPRQDACGNCAGAGQASGSRESVCPGCGGAGKTTKTKGHLQFVVTCAECGGAGRTVAYCAECGGEGRKPRTESFNVELPAGVSTGSRIRVPGKGDAKVEVPAIDGRVIVRVPPGTQTGQIFRLRGKGAPSLLNPGLRGDQYVEIKIVVPHIADERSKEILRELAKLNPEDPRKDLWR
ncbi:MAG: J domain-containing protein [Acidobacteria bacterium]|nr:J domain-containing protein [Acidobacteriota bacterium]